MRATVRHEPWSALSRPVGCIQAESGVAVVKILIRQRCPGTRSRAGKSCGHASAYRHEALAMPCVQPLPIGVCGQRMSGEARHLLSA
ncbi:MAG: hypothetical protein K1W14_09910 [Muribaculaceae bacterium]